VGELVNMHPEARGADAAAELDLVEACRRGDRQALHTVFTAHAPYLERLLQRVVGSRNSEIEDLLQSTFVAAIGAFPRFRGEAQVRTWLARIAIRTAQERLRRAEHRRRGELPSVEEVRDASGREAHREHDLDTQRKLDRLYEHLEAIGTKKRVAFVLHVFEGHPMDEVAALTGASVTATKSRVFWARRELLRRATRDPLLRDLIAKGGEP
jgi:RNA polymerase sigma-70 factor, ECF subfamily